MRCLSRACGDGVHLGARQQSPGAQQMKRHAGVASPHKSLAGWAGWGSEGTDRKDPHPEGAAAQPGPSVCPWYHCRAGAAPP